jgi:flagellar basal body-associated protein FliL
MKVFLSYSYSDYQIVQNVRNYLIHHGIDVFDQKNDITTGSNLSSTIYDAINRSDAVLFFVSKNAEKSEWVQQEISLAVANKLKGNNVKLIPIIIEENINIPFFLKDYVSLDISKETNFKDAMLRLIKGLQEEKTTSVEEDQAVKITNIQIAKELLKVKSLEHEEYKKFKSRQIFFITLIATIVSSIVASIGLLVWLTNSEHSQFEWIFAFFIGAAASMLGSILYMKKENHNKRDIINKIDELHDLVRKMEANNDK